MIVEAQGGDPAALEDPARLPRGEGTREVLAPAGGFIRRIEAEAIGLAAVALGAGRSRLEDPVDHGVGLVLRRKVGERVERGEPLCTLHHGRRGAEGPEAVAARVLAAYEIGEEAAAPGPLFVGRMG